MDQRRDSLSRVGLLVSQTSKSQISVDLSNNLEVQQKSKYNATQWVTLLTLAFGNFCVGCCVSLQGPFFPNEAEKKGATATEYGLIFGVYELGVFLTAPVMGALVSKVEPKFLFNAGIFVVAISCICFGLLDLVSSHNVFIGLAFAIRISESLGAAAAQTSCFVMIAAAFPDKMATTFAILETFIGIGLITGPTLGGALFDVGGFGLPFFVMGALMIVNTIIVLFALPNPERKEKPSQGNWMKFWLHPLTLNYALIIFTSFNYIGFNVATLEPHLREFQLSGVILGLIFALPGTLYAITAPFWGWLCDKKLNAKVICLIGSLIVTVSLLFIGPMPFLHLETSLGLIIAALILKGIGLGDKLVCAFSCCITDTINLRGFPADLSTYGLVSSMFASAQSLGAFVGPSLGGYLLDTIGYHRATYVLFVLELLTILFLIIYITVTKFKTHKTKKELYFENDEKKAILSSSETSPKSYA